LAIFKQKVNLVPGVPQTARDASAIIMQWSAIIM